MILRDTENTMYGKISVMIIYFNWHIIFSELLVNFNQIICSTYYNYLK